MTEKYEIYKCSVCGNTVEVLFKGEGELVCCNQPMELMQEKTDGEHKEWHIPVLERNENGEIVIKVGANPHPMTEEHYIKMIEICNDDCHLQKYLTPKDKAEYAAKNNIDVKYARAFCNLHGLWKSKDNL